MLIEKPEDLKIIGQTIRAVSKAQSERLFNNELRDDQDYAALVFMLIESEINLSLFRAGISFGAILEVQAADYIFTAMRAAGFVMDEDEVVEIHEEILFPDPLSAFTHEPENEIVDNT